MNIWSTAHVHLQAKGVVINKTLYDIDLSDLPACDYTVIFRFRRGMRHSSTGYCDYEKKLITVTVNDDLTYPNKEVIYYRSRRITSRNVIKYYGKRLTFRTPIEIIRFVYCHELSHYLDMKAGKNPVYKQLAAERFALAHFKTVTVTPRRESARNES